MAENKNKANTGVKKEVIKKMKIIDRRLSGDIKMQTI